MRIDGTNYVIGRRSRLPEFIYHIPSSKPWYRRLLEWLSSLWAR